MFAIAFFAAYPPEHAEQSPHSVMTCSHFYVIDGDTFECNDERIRLNGIDTPEMPDHCRPGRKCVQGDPYAAKKHLEFLMGQGPVTCIPQTRDHYDRIIARCRANNVDLSCAMLDSGMAQRRYSHITCPF